MWKKRERRSLHIWWSFNICPRSYQQIKVKRPAFLTDCHHISHPSVTAKDPRLRLSIITEVHLVGPIHYLFCLPNPFSIPPGTITHRELHPLLWRFSSSANLDRNLALLKWYCISSSLLKRPFFSWSPWPQKQEACAPWLSLQPPVHVFSFLEILESRWTHAAQPARCEPFRSSPINGGL